VTTKSRESAHTPGPWTEEPSIGSYDGARQVRATREAVAIVVGRSLAVGRTDEIVQANARLIAQAPALLEALRDLVEHGDRRCQDVDAEAFALAFDRAEAAIRAATGGSQ